MILLSVIASALMLLITIRNQNKTIEDALVNQHKLLAEIISQNIEAGYISQQWPFQTLEQISECEDIVFWWIVKPDGKIYLANDAEMFGKYIGDSLNITEIVIKNAFYRNEKIKLIVHPLDMGGEKLWQLYLGISLKSVIRARNKMLAISIGLFVLIIIFAILLSFYLARSVTRPLKKLAEACDKVSIGDFRVKIKAESGDEIGQLARSFGRMVNSLKILMKKIK